MFTSQENCSESQMYGFTLDIRCDEGARDPIPRMASESVAENNCHPRVYLESDAGKTERLRFRMR